MIPGNQYTSVLIMYKPDELCEGIIVSYYRSESPSQVFFIILQWLLSMINPLKPNVTLAYDNICNLDRMKVAKHPLPLPKLLDTIWIDVTKIIDVFHFPNHVSEKCKKYIAQRKSKAKIHHSIHKPVNKRLFGLEDLSTSYVL